MDDKNKRLLEDFIEWKESKNTSKYVVIEKKYIKSIRLDEFTGCAELKLIASAPRGTFMYYEFTGESPISQIMDLIKEEVGRND